MKRQQIIENFINDNKRIWWIVDAAETTSSFLTSPEKSKWHRAGHSGFGLKNPFTHKWFAVFTKVPGRKIGLDSDEEHRILLMRFNKYEAEDFVVSTDKMFPPSFFSKRDWYCLDLEDESIDFIFVMDLLKLSNEESEKR